MARETDTFERAKNRAYCLLRSRTAGPQWALRGAGRTTMFRCERCGSGFSPIRVTTDDSCPRCLARDGVRSPFDFAPFSATSSKACDDQVEASRDEEVEQTE